MDVSRRQLLGSGALVLLGGCVDPFSPKSLVWLDNGRDSPVTVDFRISESPDSPVIFSDSVSLEPDEIERYGPADFDPGDYYFALTTADGMEWGKRQAVSTETPYDIQIEDDGVDATVIHVD